MFFLGTLEPRKVTSVSPTFWHHFVCGDFTFNKSVSSPPVKSLQIYVRRRKVVIAPILASPSFDSSGDSLRVSSTVPAFPIALDIN